MTSRRKRDASQEMQQALTAVLEAAAIARDVVDLATKMVRIAQGTEDVTAVARRVRRATEEVRVPDTNGHKKRGRPSPDGGALYQQIEGLIRERPMSFREILEATGTDNPNRIKGAITTFQRAGKPVINLGTKGRARWFMPAADAVTVPARKKSR